MAADATASTARGALRSMFRPGYAGGCDDPQAAPARHRGPDAAPRFTLRRAAQNMVWIYAFGLLFLLFAIAALPDGDPSTAELVWRVVIVVVIALGYLASAWVADCSLRTRWLYLAAYVVVMVSATPSGAGRWSGTAPTWPS